MKRYTKRLILFLLVFQLSACAHDDKEFQSHLNNMRCDEAAQKIPGSTPLGKTADSMKYVAKNVAAYSYVTANYTTEVLWDVTAGVVLFVGLCALPAVAIAATAAASGAQGSHIGGFGCVPISDGHAKGFFAPPLGRKSLRATQELRCPNLTEVSQSLNKVADCYEHKGDSESLKKAVQSLENIELSKNFFTCLEPENQVAVRTRREDLQRKILQAQ